MAEIQDISSVKKYKCKLTIGKELIWCSTHQRFIKKDGTHE